jgi:predicted N-acyltransferase
MMLPTVAAEADETAVYPQLLKGIRQLVWRRHALGVRLVFLEEAQHAALLQQLRQANYLISEGIWENDLHIEWPTFEAYVASLKSSHRNSLRKQRKKVEQAGIEITTELPADTQTIYALFERVAQKNRSQLLYNRDFLQHAHQILGSDHFKLFRAVYQGQTVACLMMYHDRSTARLAAIGLDYDVSQTFNLYRVLIYAAIECCIEMGIQQVLGGMSRYDIKRRIGFVSRPTFTATDAWLSPLKKGYSFTPNTLRDDSET